MACYSKKVQDAKCKGRLKFVRSPIAQNAVAVPPMGGLPSGRVSAGLAVCRIAECAMAASRIRAIRSAGCEAGYRRQNRRYASPDGLSALPIRPLGRLAIARARNTRAAFIRFATKRTLYYYGCCLPRRLYATGIIKTHE